MSLLLIGAAGCRSNDGSKNSADAGQASPEETGLTVVQETGLETGQETGLETGGGDCESTLWYLDGDGDGFGDSSISEEACEAPEGHVADDEDCDDDDPWVFPEALELCNDTVDRDCDEGIPKATTVTSASILTKVPSSAAGPSPAGIAVKISYLMDEGGSLCPRHPVGAPVVVVVPGGTSPGGHDLQCTGRPNVLAERGVVVVELVLPGGTSASCGVSSDGTFDYRGQRSREALRDVLRFAAGDLDDIDGTPLKDHVNKDHVNGVLNPHNLGIYAISNGGTLSTITLGDPDLDVPDVAFWAGFENPSQHVFPVGEIGNRGGVNSWADNPYYTPRSCTPSDCEVDRTSLALDPDLANATTVADDAAPQDTALEVDFPTVFFDGNGDGVVRGPEWKLSPAGVRSPLDSELRAVLSVGAADVIGDAELVAWGFFNVAETAAYWDEHDASRSMFGSTTGYEAALDKKRQPHLAVAVAANVMDHGYEGTDHAKIRAQIEGWLDAGASFVRLNPDRCYYRQLIEGEAAGQDCGDETTGIPDNLANTLTEWDALDEAVGCATPEGCALAPLPKSDHKAAEALVLELVDRVAFDQWRPDLDQTLWYYAP